ncbi:anti-sigma factor [Rhodoplanes sp. Z2-YC6860]|uniref:anti-sigma factor n=1 Tax=Rhodoplanes sp. Z2-YC6860 TaxID=674703 RepID=UPI00078C3817|nr:anti-sigma factor [Rhodoplanes sp. Z2-YC6860]AMN40103.1 anti-sigma factor, RskA family [Rhodoplanes sp. Z2-YC6860]
MTITADDKASAGEYVLGVLEGEAQTAAEQRIASDAEFAREVEAWRTRFAAFDDTAEKQSAGEALWRNIESGVSGSAASEPASPSPWSRFWNSLPAMRAAALGTSFAALLLAVGLGFALRTAYQQPTLIAVLVDGNRTGAVVQAFADGRVVLMPLTDISVPSGRAIEVWTLPSRERGPVSVGLMDRARSLTLSLKDLPAPKPDQLFEMTLEPATGSPTGRPTGPILFKGNTAEAL